MNGFSSNYNIHHSRQKDISILKRKLDTYDADPTALQNCAFMIVSGDDGFFTNIDAVLGFFRPYKNVTLSLIIYSGENQYTEYEFGKLLHAISNIKSNSPTLQQHSKYHNLVMAWIGIAVNKELLAQANRDLKRFIPQKRNASIVYEDDGLPPPPPAETVVKTRGNRLVVEKYGIALNNEGHQLCPAEGCAASIPALGSLRDHILDHCRQAGKCVLCPDHHKNPFTPETFQLNRRGYKKAQYEHVDRHLPPTYHCQVEGGSKSFHTESDYLQHQEGHDRSQQVDCHQCGQSIRKTYLKQHLQSHYPARDKNNDVLLRCEICGTEFSKPDMFYKHTRSAHRRRDQIVGTALSTGLFASGLPGLGLDVSAAMEESTKLKGLLPLQEIEGNSQLYVATQGKLKVNGKSVGDAVRFTS
ncbi:hypothetical protein H2200_003666 [Cladophialophora chaetospira]|uniref:C2H2-type domain-containing protein n=1 Tax=Cladophialophora chaetospira TaxID=386627 RepID=A0AA38XEV2_9EURO|nr:hypothetical protein H2200_003666 [Cladophialophora chaetospira]